MISAVAARKAALAAASSVGTPPSTSTATREKLGSRSAAPSSSKPVSKRKSSEAYPSGVEERKRTKIKDVEDKGKNIKSKRGGKPKDRDKVKNERAMRYFTTASAIEVEEQDQVTENSSNEASGSDMDMKRSTSKRRCSPSQIAPDSSEDENQGSMEMEEDNREEENVTEIDLFTIFPQSKFQKESHSNDTPMSSTFQPSINENVFTLTPDEINTLLPSPIYSSPSPVTATTLVILPPHETICLLGTCSLTVLHGSITILGTTLFPSKCAHSIFAPSSSPLPIIQSNSSPATDFGLNTAVGDLILPQRIMIEDKILQRGAVLLFQELKTGVEGLGKICKTFDGVFEPSKWQRALGENLSPFKIPGLYLVSHQTRDVSPHVLPHTWFDSLEKSVPSIDSPQAAELCGIYLVKGPKTAGKSTFARTVLNRLLEVYQRVAYLECDLGQSEFTPGGMVALNIISTPIFGPPFTHPTLPTSAHYIGSSTPRTSPSHYLEAVEALLQVYRSEIQTPSDNHLMEQDASGGGTKRSREAEPDRIQTLIPLVINTMGWIKGLGSDLTRRIEEWADPTEVFVFQSEENLASTTSPVPIRRFGAFHLSHGGNIDDEDEGGLRRVYQLQSAPVHGGGRWKTTTYTPADHRSLSVLSYFHAVFPSVMPSASLSLFTETRLLPLTQVTARSWNTSLPLVAFRPYEVDCALALDKIVFTGAGSEDVVPEEAGRVVNGALVGVISCGEEAFAHASDHIHRDLQDLPFPIEARQSKRDLRYTQHHPPPSPTYSTCVGLALVRAVAPHLIDGSGHDTRPIHSDPSSNPTSSSPPLPRALLHVLTPLPPALLGSARAFVKGEMELPIWGMLDFRSFESQPSTREGDESTGGTKRTDVVPMEQGKTPFLQWGRGAEGVLGAEKRRVRRNLMRKGQSLG